MCRKVPDEEMIRRMYDESGTPCNVIDHMKAVADYQDRLLDDLEAAGVTFDRELLRAAALLHDIKRLEKNHAAAGAKYIADSGYPEVAALIEGHHSPADPCAKPDELSAADILYYADKRIAGSEIVTDAVYRTYDRLKRIGMIPGRYSFKAGPAWLRYYAISCPRGSPSR